MPKLFGRILCPVDFDESSMAALDEAARLAAENDAVLFVMHVVFVPLTSPVQLEPYVTVSLEPEKLELEKIARTRLANVRHQVLVQAGQPAEAINKAAEDLDVDLIVMATHGRTGVARLLLGSVAEHVVRRSQRSVLTMGPGTAAAAFKKILCPVDFDASSAAALKFAARLALQYKAALNLLHVVTVPFEPSEVPVEPPTPEWEQDARVRLEKLVSENLGDKVNHQLIVRRGDPGGAIVDAERELHSDLVVIPTHGRSILGHLGLGSVAERVVRESSAPVLTIRKRSI